MKKMKGLATVMLLAIAQFAQAANEATKSIDANATREALGMDAITIVPLAVLVVFLVVLAFGTQKIPGLKS